LSGARHRLPVTDGYNGASGEGFRRAQYSIRNRKMVLGYRIPAVASGARAFQLLRAAQAEVSGKLTEVVIFRITPINCKSAQFR